MKTIIIALLVCLGIESAFSQEFDYFYGEVKLSEIESGIYEDEFGKCYENSLLLVPYRKVTEYRNRYSNNGIESRMVEVGNFELEIAEKQSGWIKKKADRNCLSAYPNDCLVWCPINAPKRIVDVKIIAEDELIDISELNEEYRNLMQDSGFLIYSEINCELDDDILRETLDQLSRYFNEIIREGELNLFLSKFQYENNLPIGGLNLETLYELENI